MVRRFHRSIYDELDELRASMDYLYQLALEPADNPLLPEGEGPDILCRSVHTLNAEVAEHDDELTVTFDMIPGTGDAKIAVGLLNENTLRLTLTVQEDRPGNDGGNSRRPRISYSLHQMIPLPCQVTTRGAALHLKNSVLDIHLKKAWPLQKRDQ